MSNKIKTHQYGLLTAFLFGSSFPFSRIALEVFTPDTVGFVRCFFAGITILIIGFCSGIRRPQKLLHVVYFFLSGASGFGVYMLIFNTGIKTVTSATASIIIATTPVMAAFAASILYKEKIGFIGGLSIISAFVGVLVIILWKGAFSVNRGVLWMTAAAVLFCAYNLLNRKLSGMGFSSVEIVTYSTLCGSLILSGFSVGAYKEITHAGIKHIGALFYLGVFTSAFGYFFLCKGIQAAEKTTDMTNYLFAVPLIASLLGYVLLGETLNAGTAIGGSIIALSIIAFALKGRPVQKNG